MGLNFTIVDAPQRSGDWFAARRGRVTGSKASCVLMGEKTAGRADYIMQLAIERITGQVLDSGYTSAEMQRGIDLEPFARMRAEESGVIIRQTGFLRHNSHMIGTSLDGDSDEFARLWEFKCPKSTTHIKYVETKGTALQKDYEPQLMHGFYVTGAKDAVIGSYDDRLPAGLDWVQIEVRAHDLPLAEYEKALLKFLAEVDSMEAKLRVLQAERMAA